jgi:3D-(3,5/4)-trihydroxycyclohexane-1,2-dione acylhydrolase (decyclizing)
MGYEIAGGLGVSRAAPDRDAIVMVGDGSYLMMHTEIVTAVAEGLKVIIVLVQNHGYASIGHLSETVGSERYGTQFRRQDQKPDTAREPEVLSIDLAANAQSLGIRVIRVEQGEGAIDALVRAMAAAKASATATLIHINSDPMLFSPDTESWWDVPVAEVSLLESTARAREDYVKQREHQRSYLGS